MVSSRESRGRDGDHEHVLRHCAGNGEVRLVVTELQRSRDHVFVEERRLLGGRVFGRSTTASLWFVVPPRFQQTTGKATVHAGRGFKGDGSGADVRCTLTKPRRHRLHMERRGRRRPGDRSAKCWRRKVRDRVAVERPPAVPGVFDRRPDRHPVESFEHDDVLRGIWIRIAAITPRPPPSASAFASTGWPLSRYVLNGGHGSHTLPRPSRSSSS